MDTEGCTPGLHALPHLHELRDLLQRRQRRDARHAAAQQAQRGHVRPARAAWLRALLLGGRAAHPALHAVVLRQRLCRTGQVRQQCSKAIPYGTR